LRDPISSEPHGREPRVKTCSLSCSYRLRLLRSWSLRQSRGGSVQRERPRWSGNTQSAGGASILNDEQRARLAAVVEAGPIPAAHGVVRWRLADLAQWIWDEFALSVTRHTLGRELRAMGYRKLSARPRHHGQKPDDIVDFKKALPPVWRKSSSPGVGPGAAHAPQRPRINAAPQHGSSAQSASLKAKLRASSCPNATARL
ncbi:winged helix-turn-helix domain-containing protein, partial [Sphingomonas populi]